MAAAFITLHLRKVRAAGLEPARCFHQRILSPSEKSHNLQDTPAVTQPKPETLSPPLSVNPESDADLAPILAALANLSPEARERLAALIQN